VRFDLCVWPMAASRVGLSRPIPSRQTTGSDRNERRCFAASASAPHPSCYSAPPKRTCHSPIQSCNRRKRKWAAICSIAPALLRARRLGETIWLFDCIRPVTTALWAAGRGPHLPSVAANMRSSNNGGRPRAARRVHPACR